VSVQQRWVRAASNALLGLALGLVSYYAITSLVGALAQQTLKDTVGPIDAYTIDEAGCAARPPGAQPRFLAVE